MHGQFKIPLTERKILPPCPWCEKIGCLYISYHDVTGLYRVACGSCIVGGPVADGIPTAKKKWAEMR